MWLVGTLNRTDTVNMGNERRDDLGTHPHPSIHLTSIHSPFPSSRVHTTFPTSHNPPLHCSLPQAHHCRRPLPPCSNTTPLAVERQSSEQTYRTGQAEEGHRHVPCVVSLQLVQHVTTMHLACQSKPPALTIVGKYI